VVRIIRGEEWFPGWYCAEHGETAPARTPSLGSGGSDQAGQPG
jgi:hypothetical protein